MNTVSNDPKAANEPSTDVARPMLKKWLTLAVAILGGVWLFWSYGDVLSFSYLASKEEALRQWQSSAPLLAAIMAVGVYVVVAGLSLPGAAVLTLACGWFFGFWWGLIVVSFGSTGGAMVAFLLSRYLLQDWVQERMKLRLAAINDAFDREGAFYLFTLRLVPAVPFFVINAVMGLTTIPARTFWWVSQLGMLPGTAAYVYAGSTVPSMQDLANHGVGDVISGQMLVAFAALGILPLVLKKTLGRFRSCSGQGCETSPSTGESRDTAARSTQ